MQMNKATALLLALASMYTLTPAVASSSRRSHSTATPACTKSKIMGPKRRARLRVLLIRHGESQNNILHEVSIEHYYKHRSGDPALTELGEAQALATAEYLTRNANVHPLVESIDEVFISPCRRTLATAHPIVTAMGIQPKVWTEIYEVGGVHERNVGLPGMTRLEIQELYPTYELPSDVTDNGWYTHATNEVHDVAVSRIRKVASMLRSWAKECAAAAAADEHNNNNNRDRTIALVVHGDFINYLLQILLETGSDVRKGVFHAHNTSLHLVDIFDDERASVLFHNSVEHLVEKTLCKLDKLGGV